MRESKVGYGKKIWFKRLRSVDDGGTGKMEEGLRRNLGGRVIIFGTEMGIMMGAELN